MRCSCLDHAHNHVARRPCPENKKDWFQLKKKQKEGLHSGAQFAAPERAVYSFLRDYERKEYAKKKKSNDGARRHRRARHSDIQEGDVVLIRERFPGNKFHLPFEDKPWIVISHQGSTIVAKRGPEQVGGTYHGSRGSKLREKYRTSVQNMIPQ
ncbi:hypothetical protein NDU88_000170 [Pleurodeles waltl]|uniref:Uncharacterized protein n=1 Tax=Pleurodeles waltl TaxID=8319 RepID=A0AAV7S8S4_PLEWA|nr:hypothetical protein NDU88_000170 [Pleurodeles waltl]